VQIKEIINTLPLPIKNRQQLFKREGGSFLLYSFQIKRETLKIPKTHPRLRVYR